MSTTKRHVANVAAFVSVVAALHKRSCTLADLMSASGLGEITVRKIVHAMQHHKIAHLNQWLPDRRGVLCVAQYTFGAGVNVKKPVRTKADMRRDKTTRGRELRHEKRILAAARQQAELFTWVAGAKYRPEPP